MTARSKRPHPPSSTGPTARSPVSASVRSDRVMRWASDFACPLHGRLGAGCRTAKGDEAPEPHKARVDAFWAAAAAAKHADEVAAMTDEELAAEAVDARSLLATVARGRSNRAIDAQWARVDAVRTEQARRAAAKAV